MRLNTLAHLAEAKQSRALPIICYVRGYKMRVSRKPIALVIGAIFVTASAQAVDTNEVITLADQQSLTWQVPTAYAGATIVVSGPDGIVLTKQVGEGGELEVSLKEFAGQVADGTYTYEVVLTPHVSQKQRVDMQIGREMTSAEPMLELLELPQSFSPVAGSFGIKGGQIIDSDGGEAVAKDQVIVDDLIVDGSACIGTDCTNGENFGFDTLRLKENNTRIKFDDTSSSGSFPNVDWQLTANESANGGLNKFSIEDTSNNKNIFTLEANSPTNSIYVDNANGFVGFRTNQPVLNLHVKYGNTPGLRLEQDGSSGFASQTWDLAGNETNFFVRDVTNGSKLPFKVFPNAPTNSLTIEGSTGDIGMGTQSPTAPLHIQGSDGQTQALIEETSGTSAERQMINVKNNGGAQIQFEDSSTGTQWQFGSRSNNNDFEVTKAGSGGVELLIDATTFDMTIRGAMFTGGTDCGSGCDAVFESGYQLPSIEEHASQMWSLGYLPNVGPTIEGDPINLTDKTGRMLNELEKAHIYIEQLHSRLERLEAQIAGDMQ